VKVRKAISILAIVGLTVVIVGLTGCGGKKSTTSTDTTTMMTTASTTTTPTGASGAAFASPYNCAQLATLQQVLEDALAGTITYAQLQGDSTQLQTFAAEAPASVKSDFQQLSAALQKVVTGLKGTSFAAGGSMDAASTAQFQKVEGGLDLSALTTAVENISAWETKNCAKS
jgi:hypothetical protein